jgi:hypothetical protein
MAAMMIFVTACNSGTIKFGTSGEGGTYSEFAEALTDKITDNQFDIRTTAGSAANLRLISKGYLDVAIAQADILDDAYNDTGAFENTKLNKNFKAVAGLYTEACQIIVRADSGIESIDDLEGKKVSIGEKESGTAQNAIQILASYGLTEKLVSEINLDYEDACEQLKKGKIDAFFYTIGTNTSIIASLADECEIRLLPISDKCIAKLTNTYNFYREYTIPSGTYTGQNEDIKTIGVTAVLVASDSLSDDIVYKITQTLFENSEKINDEVSVEMSLNAQNAIAGISIPFHSGAAKYYVQNGIDVNNIKFTERSN